MRILKLTTYLLPMILALFIANQAFAATEFISVVDTGGAGDYSSLSSWEQYNQCDLTATTTLVFSHGGITGTIADGSSVTGATSGATGTITHATDTQILIYGISGTFQSGEQVYETLDTNYVVISDAGDSAIAVASCQATGGAADTTAVTIDGWTTSDTNYIKIYTTQANRHDGVWDDTKYRLYGTSGTIVNINESHTIFEGIQVHQNNAGGDAAAIGIETVVTGVLIDSCIIRGYGWSDYGTNDGIKLGPNSDGSSITIRNSIIYDQRDKGINGGYSENTTLNVYNCTIRGPNCDPRVAIGIKRVKSNQTLIVKNCAVFNWDDDFADLADGAVDYCASDDGDGDHSVDWNNGATDWANVFTDYANGDFHLNNFTGSGTIIDQGTDLSGEGFSDDIDGQTRDQNGNGWDIGADEAAEKIYRSVGPSASSALEMGTPGGFGAINEMSISGTAATFDLALGNDVGVGDVIQYDSNNNGTIDSVCFIHGRTDSTHYTIKNSAGGTPTATSAADNDWSIYRAYTSLYNAESGNENDSLDDAVESFESWSGGKDIEASNEQWNIACYANGTTADTTAVTIYGWTTGENNYIKVYAPTETTEVGTSQRHSGKWDTSAYRLSVEATNPVLYIREPYTKVEGLQLELLSGATKSTIEIWDAPAGDYYVSHCICRGNGYGNGYESGITCNIASPGGNGYIWNNIIYDFTGNHDRGIGLRGYGSRYVYNNTVVNCGGQGGIVHIGDSPTIVVRNNITQDCNDGFYGTFDASSNFNISDVSADDAPNATFTDDYVTVDFADSANDDFHLASTDTAAKDAGTDLSGDSDLSFSDDIDGDTRPSPYWDIGADEYPAKQKAKFKGDFRFKGEVKIK